MATISVATIDDIGTFSDVASLAVPATPTAAVSHTITSGKKGVIFMNIGAGVVWMGGSTVSAGATKRGVTLFPRLYLLFRNCKADFQVWFQGEASSTIGIVEYD